MSWRKHIFTEDADAAKSSEKKEVPKDNGKSFKNHFPSGDSVKTPVAQAPVVAVTASDPACATHMDKILTMYEKGFDNLNQDGYDFFEYFQGIMAAGVGNAAAYKMALTMASSMDVSITKESLLTQSQFYINEINKVYNEYVSNGNAKKNEIIKAKGQEEQTLTGELSEIDKQIAKLKLEKSSKQSKLSAIDSTYQPTLIYIDCKLMANDEAKNKIIGSIQSVVDGINSNI